MAKGTVKWFNTQKGYGFIAQEGDNTPDVFVHYADIQGDDFKTLEDGEVVEFEITEGTRGLKAIQVVRSDKSFAAIGATII